MRLRHVGLVVLSFVGGVHCGGSGPSAASGSGDDGGSSVVPPTSGADATAPGADGGAAATSGDGGNPSGGGDGSVPPKGSDGGTSTGPHPDAGPIGDVSVLMMHNHINRDGFFDDPGLTEAALSAGTLHLDSAFQPKLTGKIYASPLYAQNGVGGKGTFYVATASNNVYAIDEPTGALAVPVKNLGTPPTVYTGTTSPGGIVGTPAIDATTRLMVLDAETSASTHTIYALSIDDLSVAWSLDVSTLRDPVVGPFVAAAQSQRSAVLIVGGIAYVTYGGYWGDGGDYHGWVVGVPLSGTSGAKAYATPTKSCGMWAAGGPSSDGTDIFVSTGNGSKGTTWGGEFAVMRFHAGLVFSGATADYWFNQNDNGDQDLSGAGPLVVDAPGMTPSSLLVQVGKDGNAYLLDRSNLRGGASPLSSASIMGGSGEMSNVPAWATVGGTTYVATISNDGSPGNACPSGTSGDLVVFKIDPTAANKIAVAWCANNNGGGSPSITTSDGQSDALVWTMGTDSKGGAKSGDSQMHAWDLATGKAIVTGSDTAANTRHFTTPIAVHGRVLTVGDNTLYAFKP
ncbi:MAG TPA: hypothetical protein VGI39_07580 [Polyangiaceae bacterium]